VVVAVHLLNSQAVNSKLWDQQSWKHECRWWCLHKREVRHGQLMTSDGLQILAALERLVPSVSNTSLIGIFHDGRTVARPMENRILKHRSCGDRNL